MKLTLEQMREWKHTLAGMDDTTLQNVVVYNRDCSSVLPSHPWSFYHLARDEQVNRLARRVSDAVQTEMLHGGTKPAWLEEEA